MTHNEFSTFLQMFPRYTSTQRLDDLRAGEYARLDALKHVYLDYTGGALYAETQLLQHRELLSQHVFGNPHSSNPASQATTVLVESARAYVLKFFNANPDEYDVIFTTNASAALKLVGESYPFAKGGHYLLTFDNHNSVNGIREFAHAHNAETTYIPVGLPEMRVDEEMLDEYLALGKKGLDKLFAFPAQSNFSSVLHPLEWVAKAQTNGWDVLLDAAAFVHSNCLDLSQVKPEFVSLSFYKIFGYPTGVGALIVSKKVLGKLHRPWFAGGTITVASVQAGKYYLAEGHTAFEDGTLDYLDIPAVEIGLKYIESISYGLIHERVRCLTGWLLHNLTKMKHSGGHPLVRVYGPTTMIARGGAVALNFYDKDGHAIDHRYIEAEAGKKNISLRTGCFCNPGAGEIALEISRVELDVCFASPGHEERLSMDDLRVCIDGKNSGAVRISLGMVTNFDDVQALLRFCDGLLE